MKLADLDPRAVAIAAKIIRSRSRQQFRVEDRCFDKQLDVIWHQARRKAVMCSRRAGKSFTNAPALLDSVTTPPYTNVFYAAPTFKRAKRILWSQLKEINRAHGLGGIPNETEAMITFPDLGPDVHVYLIGLKDKAEADKGRGIPGKLWIIDECFPAGTLIDGVPIEEIRVGDVVTCVDHATGRVARRRVVRTMQRQSADIVEVSGEGFAFSSTADHPVFVRGKGYVSAKDLSAGDMCCLWSHVREDALPVGQSDKVLRRGVPHKAQEIGDGGEEENHRGRPQEAFGAQEDSQSDVQRIFEGQASGDVEADWAQAEDPRREWPRTGGGGADACRGDRVEDSRRREDDAEKGVGVSWLLQAGSGGRIIEDMYRGRWSEPQCAIQEGAGCEEDGLLEWVRVEGVSRVEQAGSRGVAVYNLEVEGAHTYFANGILVHNCQDLREDVIRYAIKDVFGAGQLDHFGSMWVQGTPGPVKAGFFYDVTAGKEAHKWQQFHWTWRDNPLLPIRKAGLSVEEIEKKILEEFGLHPDDPTWLREWCGLWVEDEGALVFARPEACEWQSAPQYDWTYVLCFDIGVNDADAIAILGWRKGSRVVNLVSEDIRANQDVSDLATKLDELYEKWRPVKAVGDLGALGKKIGLEITRRWSVPIEAADKTRKFEHIALLNADIRKGHFRAPADSRFVADSRKLSWDLEARAKNERKVSPRYHSDICDSVLYGHRITSAFQEAPPPPPETPELAEERLIRLLEESVLREDSDEFGDYAENGW